MYSATLPPPLSADRPLSTIIRSDPRALMGERLPRWVQPFLTWVTARPLAGEPVRERSAQYFVVLALAQALGGAVIAWIGLASPFLQATVLLPAGLMIAVSGLGLFQVVVFHHCSHGTVFTDRQHNVLVGRMVSAVLLFKHFDIYKHEHMLHHSPNKLLTEEDEFADFVFGTCGLQAGLPKRKLWRKVLISLISPAFHLRFAQRRIAAALFSHDRTHNAVGIAVWGTAIALSIATGHIWQFVVVWVLPVTVLLQIATVFRILCEHRFPEPDLIKARGRDFHCHATAGVFPGREPPAAGATSLRGLMLWAAWWADLLAVHLPVRVLVLVGDAPCHDYHHRRPATRRWTSYIQARQNDLEAGSPGFRTGYNESWGLFRAVDASLASLSRTPPGLVA